MFNIELAVRKNMVEMEEKVCNEKRFVKTTTALSKSR